MSIMKMKGLVAFVLAIVIAFASIDAGAVTSVAYTDYDDYTDSDYYDDDTDVQDTEATTEAKANDNDNRKVPKELRKNGIVTSDNGEYEVRIEYKKKKDTLEVYYHKCIATASEVTVPKKATLSGGTYDILGYDNDAFADNYSVKKVNVGDYIFGEDNDLDDTAKYFFKGGAKKTITLKVSKDYAKINGIPTNVSLFDGVNKYIINVAKGTYYVSFSIYSNTTVNVKGSKFKESHVFFGDSSKKGYNGGHDMKLIGGTFDLGTKNYDVGTICAFSHVKNVTIQGTTFKYLPKKKIKKGFNPHMIEFGGSKNVTIKNCKFYQNGKCQFNNEAIQIESTYPMSAGTSSYMGKKDGTQTKNVTITKCTISGFRYGCGSNHLDKRDHFTNMKITNNTFIGCTKYCICAYNYKKFKHTGNKMKNCGQEVQTSF